MLDAFGWTDAGPRSTNEDAFVCDAEIGFFAVADGLGGHASGEVAARLAIEAASGFVRRSWDTGELSWPCGLDRALSYDGNRLRTAVFLANRRVFRAAESCDDYTGMGTTIVGALVGATGLVVAHVGDSRLYLLRNGVIQQLTRDDSWAATILEQTPGDRTAALARHPMRHVLTNALGAREVTDIHVAEHPLSGGETLLICSDGLHTVCGDDELRRLLSAGDGSEAAARALVRAALEGGARDNVTAVVVANRT
jgi:serine/threonine protein phosphatase PrpC